MNDKLQKDNNDNNNSTENSINIKLNRMEDDIKNIINEKDEIIKSMNEKVLKQEKIIKQQSEKLNNYFK